MAQGEWVGSKLCEVWPRDMGPYRGCSMSLPGAPPGTATFGAGIAATSGTLVVGSPVWLTGSNSLTVGGNAAFIGPAQFGAGISSSTGVLNVASNVALPGSNTLSVGGTATFGDFITSNNGAAFNAGLGIAFGQPLKATAGWVQDRYLAALNDGTKDVMHLYVPGSYGGNGAGNATPRLTITNAGDVGVGAISPAAKLDVQGSGRFTSTLNVGGLATFAAAGVTASSGPLNVNSPLSVTGSNSLSVGGNSTFLDQATISMGSTATTSACATGGGTTTENLLATVTCPAGQRIVQIKFASFGTPSGSCGSYAINGACHADSSTMVVLRLCLHQQTCNVNASNALFTDPCSGSSKRLSIEAVCGLAQLQQEVLQYTSVASTYSVHRWVSGGVVGQPSGGTLAFNLGVLWDPTGMGTGVLNKNLDNVPFKFWVTIHCAGINNAMAQGEWVGSKFYGFGALTYMQLMWSYGSGFSAGSAVSLSAGNPNNWGTILSMTGVNSCSATNGWQYMVRVESMVF
eukprot:TRINITY_DN4125_c2_g1_i1.p1 TRINITY_DN4125_c2_g1~~TRINITY_DN4125_c2_g1_i1.p1  ORF type:complete len:515 (-),score=115.23 TRINITY_DN4125_c2_g1_i1:460-2004(-)